MKRLLLLLVLCALAAAAAPARAGDPPPPKLPEPTYQTVSEEVLIAMDDGVELAATVAYPSLDGETAAPGRFPVVLAMTPYGRNGVCGCIAPTLFAERGMVGAVADVRGTGGSGGDLEGNYFSPREARDGYLLIEHFGTQPYSTGKVGMAGGSYVGITQYLAAEQQPPHLAAITPAVAISDLYRDGFAHGGIPSLFFDAQYIGVQGAPGTAGTNTDPALLQQTLAAKLGQSPPGSIAFDYLSRPEDDQFYRDRSPIYEADRIEVPVLDIGGWQDGLLRGATEMYTALSKRPGVETRLFMDPCTHKGCGAPFAPFNDPPGLVDQAALIFEFLDEHLRGTKVPDRPPVELYVQGRDEYLSADRWPPAGTSYERLALGDGTLGEREPGGAETGEYVSDPAAGFSMAFNRYGTVAATPYAPTDQRLEGPHGLTFRTPAFERPRAFIGPIALHLEAASTATDTDWYAKLSDVAADGSESIITEGALRASHRALDLSRTRPERPYHAHVDPQPLEPDRFYEFDVEIWPTAYELPAGHRLQLRVTSSDLPTHLPGRTYLDRDDPTTARVDLLPPATNTVRYEGSYLVVPKVANERPGTAPRPPACSRRTKRLRVRKGRRIVLRISGVRPRSAVHLRGRQLSVRRKADRNGRVRIRLRPRRSGRAVLSASVCAGQLKVAVRRP